MINTLGLVQDYTDYFIDAKVKIQKVVHLYANFSTKHILTAWTSPEKLHVLRLTSALDTIWTGMPARYRVHTTVEIQGCGLL